MVKLCFLVGSVVVGGIAGAYVFSAIAASNGGSVAHGDVGTNGIIWGAIAGLVFGVFMLGKSSK